MHDTEHSIYDCIIYMEYDVLCMSLHVHLGEYPL